MALRAILRPDIVNLTLKTFLFVCIIAWGVNAATAAAATASQQDL